MPQPGLTAAGSVGAPTPVAAAASTSPPPRRARRLLAAVLATVVAVGPACADSGEGGDGGGQAGGPPAGERDETEEPHEMTDVERAAEAYVAGYPLVVSMRTMQRLGGLLGVNTLFWQPDLAGPGTRTVVAPNRDTLYSIAVLDLRSEPMVLTVPEVTDRYFTYQFLDTWTESFAYVGTRATGGLAGTWMVAPPEWDGDAPPGVEVLRSDTPLVFLLGRFLVDDHADAANVAAISREVALRPLSVHTGEAPAPPPPPLGAPLGTPQDIPTDAAFFDELGDALAVNEPPTSAQHDVFDAVADLGVGSGQHPTATASAAARRALDAGAAAGDARIGQEAAGRAGVDDGWSANLDVGRYGDDTLLRALVARIGWGANVPDEAVYPVARVDAGGEPLDGTATYRIRFEPGELPPVDAFWSLSAYGPDMFFTPHPSGRYTIGDRTSALVQGQDGSLEIVLSATEPPVPPGAGPVNWLPVPEGPFVLMLRLYLPRADVLAGDWAAPPIERVAA